MASASPQSGLPLFSNEGLVDAATTSLATPGTTPEHEAANEQLLPVATTPVDLPIVYVPDPLPTVMAYPETKTDAANAVAQTESTPAETLFSVVREVIQRLLKGPMKEAEVATALGVTTAQAKAWLQRLDDESVIEKQKKPAGYSLKQNRLFE